MNKLLRDVLDPGRNDKERVTKLKRKRYINPCVKEYKRFLENERGEKNQPKAA